MACFLIAVLMLLAVVDVSKSTKNLTKQKKILDNILSNTEYDPSIRPASKNGTGPVDVEVNVYVRELGDINDVTMDYNVQLTFRQSWYDYRLKYDDASVDHLILTRPEMIWTPDTFFSNEKSGQFHNILMPNVLVRIFPDGKVLYSIRISLKLYCLMNLRSYPLDSQTCQLIFASYAYTTDDLVYDWKKATPIQIRSSLRTGKFSLNAVDTDYCTSNTTTGTYSCLKINFHFTRDIGYYIQQSYIPSTFLVILSWLPFWLDSRSTGIRMGIWLVILLAMFFEAANISASSPKVSYTKAIDVWTGMCLCFITCVVIELCFISHIVSKEEKRRMQSQLTSAKDTMCIDDGCKESQLHSFTSTPLKWLNRFASTSQRIDVICRFLFPAAFAFFNFIYWITYAAS